jgi:hypothetical protein
LSPETDPFGQSKWSIVLYPNQQSLSTIKEMQKGDSNTAGIRNTLGMDDDGYYMRFQRQQHRLVRGQNYAYTRPEARDAQNMPMDGDTLIGNGSDVTIKLEKYRHNTPTGKKAYAVRWEAIKVDNLVPFNPKEDYVTRENEQFAGLEKQPAQVPGVTF